MVWILNSTKYDQSNFRSQRKPHISFAILVIIEWSTCYGWQHLLTARTEERQPRKARTPFYWRIWHGTVRQPTEKQTHPSRISLMYWKKNQLWTQVPKSEYKCSTLMSSVQLWTQVSTSEFKYSTLHSSVKLWVQATSVNCALNYPTLHI